MDFNSDKVRWGVLVIAGVLLTVLVYGQIADQVAEIEQNTPSVPVYWHASNVVKSGPRAANPASLNCIKLGGKLKLETSPGNAQYGVCEFASGGECEEWALMRNECPVGGIKIAANATPQARYCQITGGKYTVVKPGDIRTEVGSCTPVGSTDSCDATAYWFGKCPIKQ